MEYTGEQPERKGHHGGMINYDNTKFKELLLYVSERSVGDPHFGKTKLNKILYYIDFQSYGMSGEPVSGAHYVRRPYGPVPREIVRARRELEETGAARVEAAVRFGYPQGRLVAQRPADTSVFSKSEMELIDDVLRALRGMSAVEVSELSHREPGWRVAKDGEQIPYCTVFLSSRSVTDDDLRRGQEIYQALSAVSE